MKKVLILGASGYIGRMLVHRLLQFHYSVRCLVRDPSKLSGSRWQGVDVIQGDVLLKETLVEAFRGIDVAFYLVHSMTAGEQEFEKRDRIAALNVADVASTAGLQRLIYLGGLGKRESVQSAHLRSRHEVGEILRKGSYELTEFRAAVIVGAGGASFEMVHQLVKRLPLMICPRWVNVRTQPIGIEDVLRYLVECLEIPETSGRALDIGGPDVLTYKEMMLTTARVLGLRRFIIDVPVLTPRLSSYWVKLVTPIPTSLARALIESLRYETVCENHDALSLFNFRPDSFEVVVRRALDAFKAGAVESTWKTTSTPVSKRKLERAHMKQNCQRVKADVPAEILFRAVSSIGGENGWPYADWLWKIRGFIDQQLGGVGLRRGRRHPTELKIADALDFWRVEDYKPGELLLLRAEMKVWGEARLEFRTHETGPNSSLLIQTARYYPKGLAGILYWYSVYPVHILVFRGLAKAVVRVAQSHAVVKQR